MKPILCAVLTIALLLGVLWTAPLTNAQSNTYDGEHRPAYAPARAELTKVAAPERTVATFGNGKSAMALLDGKTDSGYQMMALGKECTVTLNLGNYYNVARILVFTYNENYTFRIEGSLDGVNYMPIAENEISVNYSPNTGYVLDFPAREFSHLRLVGLSGQYGYFSLYEIEVYADFSVANPLAEVSIPYNTTATLANGGNASLLLDGKTKGGYQMIPEGENCRVSLDMTIPYSVKEIAVYTYGADYRFRIEGSLDGINYLSLGENTPTEDYDPEKGYRITVESGQYRFIRLVGLSGQYGFFSLYEIDVFADLTPDFVINDSKLYEVSVPKYSKATLANGSEVPILVDGNPKGSYRMIPEGEDCYVILELCEEYILQKVCVYTYSGGYGFTLEGSLDGIHYQPLGVNDSSAEYDPDKGYTVTVTRGSYRYLRIRANVCPYGFFSLYEIDVFATTPPPLKGDLDRNYVVNVEDLNLMLIALSTSEDLPSADLDENGVLNVEDLNELLIILSTQN